MTETAHGHILAVREEIIGDHLSADAAIAATTLLLNDLSAFDETGGQVLLAEDTTDEIATYTGFTAAGDGLTLSAGLVAAHVAGTAVQVYPQRLNRIAYVQLDDLDREPVPVRVPFTFKDRVPLGQRSEVVGDDDTTADSPEEVLIRLVWREWELADVLRKSVVIDGSLIDTTLLPPISDGTPPGTVTGLTLTGALRYLLARWTTDTATTDTVVYDVHISTSSGFTPDATNQLTSVAAGYAFIYTLANGTALSYGTTYYVKIVARDLDGTATASSQASASLVKAVTADLGTGIITANEIAANTLTANEIAANAVTASELAAASVTAAKLEATLILASAIKTATSGQRLEIDTAGLRLYDSAGAQTVDLPTGGGLPAQFAGEILTGGSPVLRESSGLSKCRCEYTAGANLTDAVTTFIRFGTETRDTDSYHAATTDSLSANVPPALSTTYGFVLPFVGDYLITIACTYANNSAGRRVIGIWDSAGTLLDSASTPAHPTTAMRFFPGPFWITAVTAGDTIYIGTIQATGGTLALQNAKLGIVYLGAS